MFTKSSRDAARVRTLGFLLAGFAALGLGARAGLAQQPEGADPRLERAVSLEVRAATVGSVAERLSGALGLPMDTDRSLAGERITLYATNSKVRDLQNAVAALFQTGWTVTGSGEEARYRLQGNDGLLARAEALRARRRSEFVQHLLETEQQVGRSGAQAVAARLKAEVARRRPELPQESLDQITPAYVAQTLLLEPLRFGLAPNLLRSDLAWMPLNRLNVRQLNLAATFYLGRAPERLLEAVDEAPASAPGLGRPGLDPAALRWPRARVEYRLLYGDRWAGNLLLTRVGTSDSWAEARLSSALYALPEYVSLYPEAAQRPLDAGSYKPIDVQIDPAAQTWDQALASISRRAGINVVSDVYLRPDVFRPAEPRRSISGATLTQLLDKVADAYGYFWWKHGDFYVFRHRMWAEERRVSVPDRVLQTLGSSLAANQALSSEALNGLAALTEEQLLTLHLYGSAAGKEETPERSFDFEEVSLGHAGLALFSQLSESQRELARGRGLPFTLMNAGQQFLFASLAYDRGIEPFFEDQQSWGFRLADRFERRRLGTGWAEVGHITMDFDCGVHGVRTARLAARAPAHERAQPKEEEAQ